MVAYDAIDQTFKRLSDEFGVPRLADYAQVSKDIVAKIVDGKYENTAFYDIGKVCDAFNFSFDNILEERIDTQAVVDYVNGDQMAPRKYLKNAMSSKRICRSVFSEPAPHISLILRDVLRYLQISPNFFSDDGNVSTELTFDIKNKIAQNAAYFKYSPREVLFEIGQKTALDFSSSSFAKSFCDVKDFRVAIEKIGTEVFSHIEKSHEYRVMKLNHREAIIRRYPKNDEIKHFRKNNKHDFGPSCMSAMGWLSVVPLYSQDQKEVRVTETKCFYTGSKYCEWLIDFENTRQPECAPLFRFH